MGVIIDDMMLFTLVYVVWYFLVVFFLAPLLLNWMRFMYRCQDKYNLTDNIVTWVIGDLFLCKPTVKYEYKSFTKIEKTINTFYNFLFVS